MEAATSPTRRRTLTAETESPGVVLAAPVVEDKVVDFIDGTLRQKTPEEYVRQNVERGLVQEYRYPREDIAVEFRVKVGAARKAVDIAVFAEGAEHLQQNILILLECKKEGVSPHDKKEGVAQLHSYMAACPNCRFGMWTNGTDQRLCYRREDSKGIVEFDEVVDIPLKGDELKDRDAPDRAHLRAATGDNLLLAFKRCHNYIAGNQGLQKAEAFWELLKLIFCKIEDERSLDSLAFYVTNREQKTPDGQLKTKKRLDTIFQAVKEKYPTIFKPSDMIELNRTVLSYVVAQLQGYSLLRSRVDVKGVAYEEIVGSNLRGDRGEFFTPRNACRMAVAMLDPEPGQRIIDPACGTGGFLVIAMNQVLDKLQVAMSKRWRDADRPSQEELSEYWDAAREYLKKSVVGLDINPNLVRAAKMNMVMNNDGSGGMTQADSLKDPVTWSDETQSLAALGTFDYLFTNPPFGTNIRIDSEEVLRQYDLAAMWDWDLDAKRWVKRVDKEGHAVLQGNQPPEILFIERALQFLKPGTGRMAIVIPNGILNNAPLGYVRQWILERAQVLAIVDMQRDLFQPHNDTQTSIVFLRRKAEQEVGSGEDYPIFMAVADRIGHDKRGNPIYRRDFEGAELMAVERSVVTSVEGGETKEQVIEERIPIVDDQLSDMPKLYADWRREHRI